MLGKWVQDVPKRSNYINAFPGIDVTEHHQEGTLESCYGISTEKYPCLSNSKGIWFMDTFPGTNIASSDVFDAYETWTERHIQLIVKTSGQISVNGVDVQGAVITYQDARDVCSFCTVNSKIIIWPYRVMIETSGTISYSVLPDTVPQMDYVCAHKNRLWGVSNASRTVYASSLGEPDNFTDTTSPTAGAYAVAIGSDGEFTGIVSYGDSVLLFKEDMIHKFLGDGPSDYYMTESHVPGIRKQAEKSAVIIENILYYAGSKGIYAYNGSSPSLLSHSLGYPFDVGAVACACEHNGNYYLNSCSMSKTYVLDRVHSVWSVTSRNQFKRMMNANTILHDSEFIGIGYGFGTIAALDDDNPTDPTTVIGGWEAIFNTFYTSSSSRGKVSDFMERKGVTKLLFRIDLFDNKVVRFYLKEDDGSWKQVGGDVRGVNKTLLIPIRIGRCDKYQIKIKGSGRFVLRTIYREYSVGSMR